MAWPLKKKKHEADPLLKKVHKRLDKLDSRVNLLEKQVQVMKRGS